MKRGLKRKRADRADVNVKSVGIKNNNSNNSNKFLYILLALLIILAVFASFFLITNITVNVTNRNTLLYRCTDYDGTNINIANDASYSNPNYAQVKLFGVVVDTKYDRIVRGKLSEAYCISSNRRLVSSKNNVVCSGNIKASN